jgi:ubiquinone/menaquinone biosynthesis C-methylase UbiE
LNGSEWMNLSQGFAESVEAYHQRQGREASDPAVRSSVTTNTQLVPQRTENLLQLLRELTKRETLAGTKIAEIGCGFGALAGFLAWSEDVRKVVGIDNRSDYIEAATESSKRLGVEERLDFIESDMRDLDGFADEEFDVAIVNNTFIYLTSKADMDTALREIHRVLVPGGHVLFFHANRWRWRDPFSQDPVVHLLSPSLAKLVSRMTGWTNNHDRMRLISPRELKRRLRRAGFVDAVAGVVDRGTLLTGSKLRGRDHYGMVARRPEPS